MIILTAGTFKLCAQNSSLFEKNGLSLSYQATLFNTVSIEGTNFFDQYEITVTFSNNTGTALIYDGALGAIASIEFEKDPVLEKLLKKVAWRTDNGNYKPRYDDSIPHSKNELAFGFPDGKWVRYDQPYPYNSNELFPKADKIEHLMLEGQQDICVIYILVAQGAGVPGPKWNIMMPYPKKGFKKQLIKYIPENCGCFGSNKPRGKRGDMPKNLTKSIAAKNSGDQVYSNLSHGPVETPLRSVSELENLILKNLRENTSPYRGSDRSGGSNLTYYFDEHFFSFDKDNFYFEYEYTKDLSSATISNKFSPQILKTKIPIGGLRGVKTEKQSKSSATELHFISEGGETTQNGRKEYLNGELLKTIPAGLMDNCEDWLVGYKFDADLKNFNELKQLVVELNKSYKLQNPQAGQKKKRSVEELKEFILTSLKTNTKNVVIRYESGNTPGVVQFSNYQFGVNQNILSFSVDYKNGERTVHLETKVNLAEYISLSEQPGVVTDKDVIWWEYYGQREANERVVSFNIIGNDRTKNYSTVNGRMMDAPYVNIYGFDKGAGRKNYVELSKAISEFSRETRYKK
ncbi:MAG: hypothetical protein ABIN95_07055 [Mucilaginibacter sp.]